MSRRRRSRRPRVTPVQRHYGSRVRPRMGLWSRGTGLAMRWRPSPLSLSPTLDRRTWSPDPFRRPLTISVNPPGGNRNADRIVDRSFKSVLAFADPRKVSVCVRREERKRVIHARGIAGSKVRRAKRSALSNISCR